MKCRLLSLVLLAGIWAIPQPGFGQGYGHLTGQFVLAGETPELAPLKIAEKNAQMCAVNPPLPENRLIVDAESKGIANVVVYLKKAPRNIHPNLKKPKAKTVVFDQKNCLFDPHVLLVRTDQTVLVKNSDGFDHNTHTYPFSNQGHNFLVKGNENKGVPIAYKKAEFIPTPVGCDLHPHMKAYWLVLDHPYMALTDEEGRFKIENLPAGRYEFTIWHEKTGYIDKAMKVTIKKDGTEDLGQVKVPASKIKLD